VEYRQLYPSAHDGYNVPADTPHWLFGDSSKIYYAVILSPCSPNYTDEEYRQIRYKLLLLQRSLYLPILHIGIMLDMEIDKDETHIKEVYYNKLSGDVPIIPYISL